MVILVFVGIALFAYIATNIGEKRSRDGASLGLQPVFTVLVVCIVAWLLWPVIGNVANWLVGPIMSMYHGK